MTDSIDAGPYDIRGPDWSLSFQRAKMSPQKGRSANRGVLPYQIIKRAERQIDVIVPLPFGEAIWVATIVTDVITVQCATDQGAALTPQLIKLEGQQMISFATISVDTERPIDASTSFVACTAAEVDQKSLKIEFANATNRAETWSVRVTLTTPQLYTELTGRPAPKISEPTDSFGGWRLP